MLEQLAGGGTCAGTRTGFPCESPAASEGGGGSNRPDKNIQKRQLRGLRGKELARDWKGRAARRRGAAAGREASGARALESPLRWYFAPK